MHKRNRYKEKVIMNEVKINIITIYESEHQLFFELISNMKNEGDLLEIEVDASG